MPPMSDKCKRYNYLDYAKGIAILLMLFNHTKTNDTISTWIFAFHMPIFFMIGGILIELKNKNRISITKVKSLTYKRIKQLGLPYFIFSFLLILFFAGVGFLSGPFVISKKDILNVITLQGIESLWFLPCYFVGEILMYILLLNNKIVNYTILLLNISIIIYIIKNSNNMPEIWWQRNIIKYYVSFIFFQIGYIISKIKLMETIPLWLSITVFIIFSFLCQLNGHVGLSGLIFNNGIMYFVDAIIMSICILSLFYNLEKKEKNTTSWLSFFGKSTIIILCTNNIFIEIIRLLDYKITGNALLKSGLIGNILFIGLLIMIYIPFIKFSNKKLGVLFGKCNYNK